MFVKMERYPAPQPGLQRERGFTGRGAGYRGLRIGDQVKPQLLDPALVGTLEVAADGEAVMVRRVTRSLGVVGGHRGACLAFQDPVGAEVPPDLVTELEAGHTVAVLLASGARGHQIGKMAELSDSESMNRLMKVNSPMLPWYVSLVPPLSETMNWQRISTRTPVQRDEDRVLAEVPVVILLLTPWRRRKQKTRHDRRRHQELTHP